MKFRSYLAIFGISMLGFVAVSQAEEVEKQVSSDKTTNMNISIYNNDVAFVRDRRNVDLQHGLNKIAYVGVSSQIRPETAMLYGKAIEVIEQNYNYNMLNQSNLLEAYIGKKVKTALYNEQTGKTIYDSAEVLDGGKGNPALKFSYGIETDYPGRIIFDNIPTELRREPTLVIDLNNKAVSGQQEIELAYLTGGVSWKADYVAEIQEDDKLKLNGWISLSNNSGVDYDKASVQLIAGSVNKVNEVIAPMMVMRSAKTAGAFMENGVADSAMMPTSESFADYYLYQLPIKTDIKDKQTKQVNLMTKDKVDYNKEYKLNSPLYLSYKSNETEFTKANPEVIYKLNNVKEEGLGVAIPSGTIRFFESDKNKNLQFIGEAKLPQLTVGETAELDLGQAFDIYAKGKVVSVQKISDKTSEVEVEITLQNSKADSVTVSFIQNYNGHWKIIEESEKSQKRNAYSSEWKINLPANEKQILTYKVQLSQK